MESLNYTKSHAKRRQGPSGVDCRQGRPSIASGAHVPRIDLEAILRSSSLSGAADSRPAVVAGAASLPAAPVRVERSVGLNDGTRIVFAELELSPLLA